MGTDGTSTSSKSFSARPRGDVSDEAGRSESVTIRLTEQNKHRLRLRAAEDGNSMAQWVRTLILGELNRDV